jgi:hypothetical protein
MELTALPLSLQPQHQQLHARAGQLQLQLEELRSSSLGQGEAQHRLQAEVSERQAQLSAALETIKELQGRLQVGGRGRGRGRGGLWPPPPLEARSLPACCLDARPGWAPAQAWSWMGPNTCSVC